MPRAEEGGRWRVDEAAVLALGQDSGVDDATDEGELTCSGSRETRLQLKPLGRHRLDRCVGPGTVGEERGEAVREWPTGVVVYSTVLRRRDPHGGEKKCGP
jgi:hypothetical protein